MESYSSLSNAMHTFLLAQKIIPNATKLINNELVQVFLIDTSLQASCILEHLKESSGGALYPQLSVIGFDTETCINRKQTLIDFTVGGHLRTGKLSSIPSTIQIAISHHIVFVFRCFVMCFDESTKTLNHNLFPKALCNFLKCKSITKLGVATSKDAIDLDYYFDCKANQLLDLDVIAKGLGLQKQSLAALAYMYCETTLSKKWELLSSNWDGPVNQLNQDSIWYAANDALYALKIFESMVVKPSVIPSVFPDFNKGYNGFKKYSRIHETTGKAIRGNYKPKKKSELDASMNDPKTGDKRKSTQGNSGTKKKIEVAIKQKVLFVEK